ncbi:activator of Hsp90 ATPase [Dipodascopsis uninucleata]
MHNSYTLNVFFYRHWVDKNCVEWSKAYFSENLIGISAISDDGKTKAEISKLSSLTGDVDVSQRKGKVISLFDVRLVLDYTGSIENGDSVSGTISIPEVAYDTDEAEYVFEISISSETAEKQVVRQLIKSKILPQLRQKLTAFGPDLIRTHSKDIQHPVTENKSTFTASNQLVSDQARIAKANASGSSSSSSGGSVTAYNTTTLNLDTVFNAPASEIYLTFLDPGRVTAWTRSPPVTFSPTEGGEFSLFGGNVTGKFLTLIQDKSIEMLWRLKDWKSGHHANLKIDIDQGRGETKAFITIKGVPIGQEDTTRRNFEEYYIKSIKLTFGYVYKSSAYKNSNILLGSICIIVVILGMVLMRI